MNPNSWRETWWSSSTAETSLNTHTTRLSCSYAPAESRTPESWPYSSGVKVCVCLSVCVCVAQRDKTAEAACNTRAHGAFLLSMNIYHSLEPPLRSRSWPGGAPAAVTSRPHAHRPITGRQAVSGPVGEGHDSGGVDETAGERNTVRHALFSF